MIIREEQEIKRKQFAQESQFESTLQNEKGKIKKVIKKSKGKKSKKKKKK